MRLVMDIGRTEAEVASKMGLSSPNADCHHLHHHHHHCHCQQGQCKNDNHHDGYSGDYCYFVVGRGCCSSFNRCAAASSTTAMMTCPLRTGITTNNDDVNQEDAEDVNRYYGCDTNCPRICCINTSNNSNCDGPCLIANSYPITNNSIFPCATTSPLNNKKEVNNFDHINDVSRCSRRVNANKNSFNDNLKFSNIVSCSRENVRDKRRNINEQDTITSSFNCANGSSDNSSSKSRRISRSSRSLLTRPCALYLFIVLVILDLGDLSNILITLSSNSRTTSGDSSEVLNNVISTMRRYNGFLVNGEFNNKNGHHHQYGLYGGLTILPELPNLSMDTVFLDNSVGNQLTGQCTFHDE